MLGSSDRRDRVDACLEVGRQCVGATSACLAILEDDWWRVLRSSAGSALLSVVEGDADASACAAAARSGQPVVLEGTELPRSADGDSPPIEAVVAVPVVSEGQVRSALCLEVSSEAEDPDELALAILAVLAAIATDAIRVSQLLDTAVHQLNNHLMTVAANVELLEIFADGNEDVLDAAEQIRAAASLAGQRVEGLAARKGPGGPASTDDVAPEADQADGAD